MEYLIKASAISLIFYLCYKLFLQRDTFFESNRWFLLIGLLTSFILPLLAIPVFTENTPIHLPNFINQQTINTAIASNTFNMTSIVMPIYFFGVLFFFSRFLMQLASLFSIIKKNKSSRTGPFTFVETTHNISPFSFFNYIVLNPNSFNKTELQQIITHEKIHANQKHTLDVLIGQLACIALWFNPVIWFYNKDLKQNLEFIADFKTQNTFDPKSYQSTLLKTTLAHHQMQFSNNFYNSLIKKRIVMLHKSKSKKVNLLKHTLVLPLLALFLIACSSKEATKPETQEYQTSIRKTASNANDTASNSDPLVYLDGKEVPNNTIKSINPETIEAVNVLKNEKAFEKYGDKGKHGVIEITTKK